MNKTMIAFATALTLGTFAVPAFAGDTKTETKTEDSADGSSAKKTKKTKKKNADGSTTTTEKTEKTETTK